MTDGIGHFYEFGEFRFDAGRHVLWRDGDVVALAPKATAVLFLLLTERGNLVGRDEILDKVWPGTFVEEGNLNHAVSALRKALGSEGIIQTVARRGYRFTGDVVEINGHGATELLIEKRTLSNTVIEEHEEYLEGNAGDATQISEHRKRSIRRSYLAIAGGIFILFLLAGGVWFSTQRSLLDSRVERSSIQSIAVLPLKSFDAKSDDAELRLRITDALITRLGSMNEISVRPTNSILSFANGEADILEAGRNLEVDAVLDGRIQIEGERLRVTLQLVSVRTSEQIWSGQFDGKTNEILNLQDKISAHLLPSLTTTATLAKNPTTNAEAYENYLKGRYLWNKRTKPEMKRAVEYFEQAVAVDPNFALAYAGLADAYSQLANRGSLPRFEGYAKAKEMAHKALAIDPNLSDAYSALGWILYWHDWDWAGADQAFASAIELNPNNAEAHHWRGLNFRTLGKTEEYYAEMEKALSLSPLTQPIAQNYYTVVQKRDGCEKALEYLEKFFDLYQISDERRTEWYGSHFADCGDFDKAIVMLEKIPFEKLGSKAQVSLAVAYAKTGRRERALEILKYFKKSSSTVRFYLMPCIHAALGDFDAAFADLEKGIEARDDRFTKLKTDDYLATLRIDPRFKNLLKKMNFPE